MMSPMFSVRFGAGPSVCDSLSSQIESFHFPFCANEHEDSHNNFFTSKASLIFDAVAGAIVLSSAIEYTTLHNILYSAELHYRTAQSFPQSRCPTPIPKSAAPTSSVALSNLAFCICMDMFKPPFKTLML